jgi:hypothetical protein
VIRSDRVTVVLLRVVEQSVMTRETLATASNRLEAAADATADDDATERLRDLADQLDTLAERERGPDHGRLARIENALGDITETVDEDTSAEVEAGHEAVVDFRETVDGV